MDSLLEKIVNADITDAYDALESLCNSVSVQEYQPLHVKLTIAKDALFEARIMTDGRGK